MYYILTLLLFVVSPVYGDLLPDTHPIKAKLDRLFQNRRPTESEKTLKKAGFSFKKNDKWDNVYIAKHRELRGYIIKFYTDAQVGIDEYPLLLRRALGADLIRSVIERHGLQGQFQVPHKWLYRLPDAPDAPSLQRKHFILVADYMEIFGWDLNARAWKGKRLTPTLLDGLFLILTEAGLYDSVYIDNIPFGVNGKITFIDTEHFNGGPVHFHRLTPLMSKKNGQYWESLYRP